MNEETPKSASPVGQGMDYGEQADVQQVHAAVQREKREPRVGAEPLSIWLIAVYGLAVFFGGAYLGRYSGNFSGEALDPYGGEPQAMKKAAGPQGEQQQAELSPRQKDFLGELPDLSSSQRSWRSGSVSAAGRLRVYNRRLASTGHDCPQGFARSSHGQRSKIRHRGDATVGQNVDRPEDCGRPHLRTKRVGQQCQPGYGRTNCRTAQGAGQSPRVVRRT